LEKHLRKHFKICKKFTAMIVYLVRKFTRGINVLKTEEKTSMTTQSQVVQRPRQPTNSSKKCAKFSLSKGIIHREFVPEGHTVNKEYYLGVMERLWKRILRVTVGRNTESREAGTCCTTMHRLTGPSLYKNFWPKKMYASSSIHRIRQICHLVTITSFRK